MKVVRSIVAVFLVLIIIGGVGFIGYYFLANRNMNMGTTTGTTSGQESMQGMQGGQQTPNMQQSTAVPNIIAAQNRERLSEALTLINEAMSLITIDPYSKVTVPSPNGVPQNNTNTDRGAGNYYIYPNGNSSVIINPAAGSGNITPAPTPNNPGSTNTNGTTPSNNYVYNQDQLRQLHNDIFNVAQGVMAINQLSNDLLSQSSAPEISPSNYQTYLTRYNNAIQNKTKLTAAMSLLNSFKTLANNNPYAAQNGYAFNNEKMENLNQGVYKLAQAMVVLGRLDNEFIQQISEASVGAQNLAGMTNGMDMSSGSSPINLTTILNILIIMMIIGIILGVFGGIIHAIRNSGKPRPNQGPDAA